MPESGSVIIRKFAAGDRGRIRSIGCQTAFVGVPHENIFTDSEVLADLLTSPYTDHEPQSCFVAEHSGRVVGYLIGAKNSRLIERVARNSIFPRAVLKAVLRGAFFKGRNLRFLLYLTQALLKGELSTPDFSRDFPATLHINIENGYRKQGIGSRLIRAYLDYLANNEVPGVHFGTFSSEGFNFFKKTGFEILFEGKRSYLKPYIGRDLSFFVFGKKL